MTNREHLQHTYRLGYWMFFPCVFGMVGMGWMTVFRDHSHPVNHVRDDVALFSGAGLMIALAVLQRFVARRTFTCPACRGNLWDVHQHILGTTAYSCPRCGIDMDALKTDSKPR